MYHLIVFFFHLANSTVIFLGTNRQTYKQTDGRADKQSDGQTDKQTERQTNREIYKNRMHLKHRLLLMSPSDHLEEYVGSPNAALNYLESYKVRFVIFK